METIEIQTRDYSFRVSKEWAEDHGYDKGQAVYKAALAAGMKPEITFY